MKKKRLTAGQQFLPNKFFEVFNDLINLLDVKIILIKIYHFIYFLVNQNTFHHIK